MARQKRQFTDDEINQIKSMYNEGKTILDIATQLHTSNTTIKSFITEQGLKRPDNQINSKQSSKATLYRRREAIHKTIDELTKELDYCKYKQYNTTGVEQAQWKAKRIEVRKQIQALRKEGLETYINLEAENKLINEYNKCNPENESDVSVILEKIDRTLAYQFAEKHVSKQI